MATLVPITNLQRALNYLKTPNNIILCNSQWELIDLKLIFDKEPVHLTYAKTYEELFIEVGMFFSKGEARRNNKAGVIPEGYSEVQAAKTWNHCWHFMYYIWNPVSCTCEYDDESGK